MNRRTKSFRRWRGGALVSIAMLASAAVVVAEQGSAGAASNKPFGVLICGTGTDSQTCAPGAPQVIAPGSATGGASSAPASLQAIITDETTKGAGLTIGSVNLTAPAGVTISSASFSPSGPAIDACTPTTPTTTSCFAGGVLELRGLNVAPGASITVAMSITTPPLPSSCTPATPCSFSAAAKQSNDYNGPPGNQLNLDAGSSQLGIILNSQATCTSAKKSNTCSTTLGDGGTSGSLGGTVSITTDASGTSNGNYYEAIDYGTTLDPAADCSGVQSNHDEYVSGPALTGTNARSFTVTITTADYSGYLAELCMTTSKLFVAKYISLPGDTLVNYAPAVPVTQPDGTSGYAGLVPDCGAQGVPKNNPCVVSRSQTTSNGTILHQIVASIPAGFDATFRN
ncbi:MAG: hypothetical protein KGL16_04035 [Acidobacteriota bacterium]|nr:hypothetical protein [Acidobacteriota bacterium]